MDKLEHRAVIKFLTKRGLKYHAIYDEMREVYKDDCPSLSSIKTWYMQFRLGRNNIEDDPRSGRPLTSHTSENIILIAKMINEYPRIKIREFRETLKISTENMYNILHEDLGLSKLCARYIPRNLSLFDKARRVDISRELLERAYQSPE